MTPLARNVAGVLEAALDHGVDAEAVRLRVAALRGFARPWPADLELAVRALLSWRRASDGPSAGRWRAVVVAIADLVRGGGA